VTEEEALAADTYTVDEPVPFPGTHEEGQINLLSHHWVYDGGDVRCMNCDSKSWHHAAVYPCGAEVPRQITTREYTPEFKAARAEAQRQKGQT